MKDFLSKAEIEKLKAEHRMERELRYGDRIKAILMLDSGVKASKVAEYLLLDEKTIRTYHQKYILEDIENVRKSPGGITNIHPENLGQGRSGLVNEPDIFNGGVYKHEQIDRGSEK